MINASTLTHLRALKLNALAEGLELQAGQPEALTLSFEERLALLVDREVHSRQDRKRARLLHKAQLKYPDASIEAADFTGCRRRSKSEPPRRLNIEPGVEADVGMVGCG
jgi:hypothetical protein